MFRFSLSFRSIIILSDNFKTVDQISYLSIGAFTVNTYGSQLNMSVHIKATASDSVTVIIHNQPSVQNDEGCRRSSQHVVSSCNSRTDMIGGLTINRYTQYCHSAFSRSGETLRHMAHCTVTTSVFHKTLHCTRYTLAVMSVSSRAREATGLAGPRSPLHQLTHTWYVAISRHVHTDPLLNG
jgi:hypothetical protein